MTEKKYHLVYLQMKAGRGEPVRWVLKAVGAPYTEELIPHKDIPENKRELGIFPLLEVDGKPLQQTTNICRFIGQAHGLAPPASDLWATAKLQEVADSMQDLTNFISILYAQRRNGRDLDTEYIKETVQRFLSKCMELVLFIEENMTEEGWIRSSKMTWLDVFCASYFELIEQYRPFLAAFPKINGMVEKVKKIPAIEERLKTRQSFADFEDSASFRKLLE